MKIIVFNGSPRTERGNTHWMVREFMEGAKSAGAEAENVFLAQKTIHPCRGCFTCWLKTPGRCAIQDDMAELRPKMGDADVTVFATPVYVDNVTGILKNFLDRCLPMADPHFAKDENGECRHKLASEKKPSKIVVISNCGFPEQSHFQVLSLYFKRVARNMSTEVIGEIYRGGGEILGAQSPLLLPLLNAYKKLLREAGREIAENLQLSPETRARLEKPLVSDKQYIDSANKHFDSLFSKNRPG